MALADVSGTDLLDRRTLALAARSLALRGEFLAIITDDRGVSLRHLWGTLVSPDLGRRLACRATREQPGERYQRGVRRKFLRRRLAGRPVSFPRCCPPPRIPGSDVWEPLAMSGLHRSGPVRFARVCDQPINRA